MHLGDGACFGDCLPLLLCLGNLNPDLNEKVVIFYIDLLLDTFNGTTPINKCSVSLTHRSEDEDVCFYWDACCQDHLVSF